MKNGLKFSLLLASIALGVVSISPVLDGGNIVFADTNPVYISSLSQITNMSGNYIMADNTSIELDEVWTPIGTKENPFRGTFDGNGCIISNISVSQGDYQGLFGYLDGAVVKNIKVSNIDYSLEETPQTEYFVGAIAGYATNGTKISNCEVDSGINTQIEENLKYKTSLGGLVGALVGANSVIYDVANYDDIKLTEDMFLEYSIAVGGIVGSLSDSAKIENAVSFANISVSKVEDSLNASNNIGGIAGRISGNNTKITNTANNKNAVLDANGNVGAVVGYIASPVPSDGNFSNIAYAQNIEAFGYKNSYQTKNEITGDYVRKLPAACFSDEKFYFDDTYTYSPVEGVEEEFLWNEQTLGWKKDVWVMNYSSTLNQLRLQSFQSFNIKISEQTDFSKLLKCDYVDKTYKYGAVATFEIEYEDEGNIGYYNVVGVLLNGTKVEYEMIKNGDNPTKNLDVLLIDNDGSYTLKVLANSFTAGSYSFVLEALTFNGKLIIKDNMGQGSVKFANSVSNKRTFTKESSKTRAEATADEYHAFDHWNLYYKTTAAEAYDDDTLKDGYIIIEDEYWKNFGPIYSIYTGPTIFRYASQSLDIKFGDIQSTFILNELEEEIKDYVNQDFLLEAVFEYDPYVISFNKINENATKNIEKIVIKTENIEKTTSQEQEYTTEPITIGKNSLVTISFYIKDGFGLNERRLLSSIQNSNQQPSVTIKEDNYANGMIYSLSFYSSKLDPSKVVEGEHNKFAFEVAVNEVVSEKENSNLGWIIGASVGGGVILIGGTILLIIYYFGGFGGFGGGSRGGDKTKMKKDVKNEYKKYYY